MSMCLKLHFEAVCHCCRVEGAHFVLDVMHDPGSLYAVDSEKANKYRRLGHIGGPAAGPGCESVPAQVPAGVHAAGIRCAGMCTLAYAAEALLPVAAERRPQRLELLGRGSFGLVHKAVLPDGSFVAVKTIRCGPA